MKVIIFLALASAITFTVYRFTHRRRRLIQIYCSVLWLAIALLFSPFLFSDKSFLLTGFFSMDWAFPLNLEVAKDYVKNPEPVDSSTLYFAHKFFWRDTVLNQHELPLWDPYRYHGYPAYAGGLGGFFYPLNVIFLIMPPELAWNYLAVIQFFLAGLFMYWLMLYLTRKHYPAVFGGLSFMLMPLLVGWSRTIVWNSSALWLPLVLLAGEHLLRKPSRKWVSVFALALAMSCLGGWILYFSYILIFSFLYLGLRMLLRQSFCFKKIAALAGAYILGLCLGSLQLLASLELGKHSPRPHFEWADVEQIRRSLSQTYDWVDFHWVTWILPDFFGSYYLQNLAFPWRIEYEKYLGLGTMVLFVFALLQLRQWRKILPAVILIAAAGSLYNLGFFYRAFYYLVPGFDYIPHQQTRAIFIVNFFFIFTACFGFAALAKKKTCHKSVKIILAFFAGLGGFCLLLSSHRALAQAVLSQLTTHEPEKVLGTLFNYSNRVSAIGLMIFSITLIWLLLKPENKKTYRQIFLFVLIFQAIDLGWNFKKTASFSLYNHFPAQTPQLIQDMQASGTRLMRLGGAVPLFPFQPNLPAVLYHLYDTSGWDSFFTKDYANFVQVLAGQPVTASVQPTEYKGPARVTAQNYSLLRMLNVGYLFDLELPAHPEMAPYTNYLGSNLNRGIYTLKSPLPKIYSVDHCQALSRDEVIAQLNTFDPEKTVLLEKEWGDVCSQTYSQARDISWSFSGHNKLTITYSSSNDSLLFLSQSYYPGWNATTDTGRSIAVHKANLAFQALRVPAGEKRSVTLQFFPKSLKLSLLLTVLAVLVALGMTRKVQKLFFK